MDPSSSLLLDLVRERSLDGVLQKLVNGFLADSPQFVRTGVWLLEEGPSPTPTLVLGALAWEGESPRLEEWSHAEGTYSRVPIREPLLGPVAAEKRLQYARDEREWEKLQPLPPWARRTGISGFLALPLVDGGDTLGVVATFFRPGVPGFLDQVLPWARVLADQAAAAVANVLAHQARERELRKQSREIQLLQEEVRRELGFADLAGRGPATARTRRQIALAARAESPVLLTGERGSGLGVVARAIHEAGARSGGGFVRVPCSSFPEEGLAEELFGRAPGKDSPLQLGRISFAEGGTLYLDEIADASPGVQTALLRLVEQGVYQRKGESRTRRADCRVLAGTSRDLPEDVRAGRFREDLFLRLTDLLIYVPPLRERTEDLSLLVAELIRRTCLRLGLPRVEARMSEVQKLGRYDWPGNLWELRTFVEAAILRAVDRPLTFDLPAAGAARVAERPPPGPHERVLTYEELRQRERENALAALRECDWKVSGPGGAAEALGVKPTTLTARLKALGIERPARTAGRDG